MPSINQVANVAGPAGATGLSLALTQLGLVGGPVGAAIGAGVGALISLVGAIGQGRRDANSMTENGGPQDILNKQLAAISNSGAPQDQVAQATQVAWTQFLQAANQFAAKGPEYAQVAKQAIYQTPALTNTVKSLMGGVDPLGQQFTSQVASSIPGATPQSGISVASLLGDAAGGIGGAYIGSSLNGAADAASGIGGGGLPAGATLNEDGNLINADGSLYTGASGAGSTFGSSSLSQLGAQATMPVGTGGPAAAAAGTAGASTTAGGGTSSSLFSRLFPNLISAGTSIAGGLIGSNAANNAANVQANAANNAAALEAQAGANSLAFQKQVLQQQQQNVQPWIDAGSGALKSIGDITSKGYQLPTEQEAEQTPGYQFQFDQGEAALQAYERANGSEFSGKAIKDATGYGQGLASTNYQNVVGNSLAAYNANLNPLLSVAGLGQVSTSGLNSNLSNAAALNTNTNQTTAQQVGNNQTSAAAATASGYVGGANSWLNALTNIGNVATGASTLQQLQQLISQRQNNSPGANIPTGGA